jgi:predicted HNH restriction endonuclease
MSTDDLAQWNRRQAAYKRRKELRERAIAYLGGKCRICGYNKCSSAFDFHHVDPLGKDFNISAGTSWERIERELQKCELLCSNCHREVHDGQHPGYLELEGAWGSQYDMSLEDELEEYLDS